VLLAPVTVPQEAAGGKSLTSELTWANSEQSRITDHLILYIRLTDRQAPATV
jgi:hypothetical protein